MATQQVLPPISQQPPVKQAASVPVHKPTQDKQSKDEEPSTKSEPKKQNKSSYDLLLVLIVFLVLVGGMVYALVESNRASFESKKETYDTKKAQTKQAVELTQEQIDRINAGFIDRDGVVKFIEEVESSKVYFNELSLQFNSDEPQKSSGAGHIPFTLTISGTVDNVIGYTNALLDSEYVVEITSVTTSSPNGYTKEMNIQLQGNLYLSDEYK